MTTRSNLISARVLNGGALYAHIQDKTNPHDVAVDGVTIGGGGTLADPFAVINDVFLETVSVDGTTIIGSGTALDPLKIYNAEDGKSYVNVDGAWVESVLENDVLAEYDLTTENFVIDFGALPFYNHYKVVLSNVNRATKATYFKMNLLSSVDDSKIETATYQSASQLNRTSSTAWVSNYQSAATFWDVFYHNLLPYPYNLELDLFGMCVADSYVGMSTRLQCQIHANYYGDAFASHRFYTAGLYNKILFTQANDGEATTGHVKIIGIR